MPKTRALGTPDMRAEQAAKREGEQILQSGEEFRRRIIGLQAVCGYPRSRERFAGALNMSPYRLDYILKHPEACKLHEAVTIQKLGEQHHFVVFDGMGGGKSCES